MQEWGGEGHLIMGRSEIPCRQANGLYWLGFARVRCRGSELPAWALSQFGAEPMAAALAGPEDGYLILHWPDNFQLKRLRVPTAAVGASTRRAVIVTCRDTDAATDTIHLRYFAPQYGIVEDSATGSAMRILADYWAQTCGLEGLHGRQDSPRGGELFSRLEGEIAWVGGRIRDLDETDNGVPDT